MGQVNASVELTVSYLMSEIDELVILVRFVVRGHHLCCRIEDDAVGIGAQCISRVRLYRLKRPQEVS